MKTLIIGYGNVDRQDDGLAWHVLAALAQRHGQTISSMEDELPPLPNGPDLLFMLQLTPELAETVSDYDRVCFVDAHTGAIAQEVNLAHIQPEFQTSPFTHHLTPHTCLAIADALYHKTPPAILVSVRGYDFGFATNLSPRTSALIPLATDQIMAWLNQEAEYSPTPESP